MENSCKVTISEILFRERPTLSKVNCPGIRYHYNSQRPILASNPLVQELLFCCLWIQLVAAPLPFKSIFIYTALRHIATISQGFATSHAVKQKETENAKLKWHPSNTERSPRTRQCRVQRAGKNSLHVARGISVGQLVYYYHLHQGHHRSWFIVQFNVVLGSDTDTHTMKRNLKKCPVRFQLFVLRYEMTGSLGKQSKSAS